ncbi:MAG: REP-associated tyrosine transposase [Candidatus Acidiferrales bacterium]
MSVPKRNRRVAGTYFVTSRTWESRLLFMKEPACRLFVETLLHYRSQGAYALHAFVLMPEHFHVLLTPADGTTLERAVQFIKGGSAHAIREQLPSRVPVWQRGFSDHRIRDWQDYDVHLRYIARNPIKRRLVFAAQEYRWSSASGQFRMDEPPQGLKPREGALAFGTAEAVP